jgi:hypothetical protein
MHSTILAELLNPNGCHGQKAIFLKLFCEHLQIKEFEPEGAIVEIEKYTGLIDDDYTKGGRIDILITDRVRRHIIIENKIFAGDQKNQLLRYYNFDPMAMLFYLNLSGNPPSDWSTGKKLQDDQYRVISYSDEILMWLEKCQKEAVSLPIIRETITQYINLIKYLTGQSMIKIMENDLVNKISQNSEFISSAFTIAKSIEALKRNLITIFEKHLYEICMELDLEPESENFGIVKDGNFSFNFKGKHSNQPYISLYVQNNLEDIGIGVDLSNEIDRSSEIFNHLKLDVRNKLILLIGDHWEKYENWVYFHYFKKSDALGNWNSTENWEKIPTEELKSEFKIMIEKMLKALENTDI